MMQKFKLLHISNEWWPFLLGLTVGLVFLLLPVLGFGLEYFPGDLGDARLIMYILEHGYRFISGVEPSYWNAPFMYPEPEVISYSDNLLGSMPIYAVFRLFGFDRETATQLWVIAIWILNFAATYAFLKWLFKNRYAAVLGALVFAFSIALQSQMTHAQVFPRFPMPLALWSALLFSQNFRPIHFAQALLLVVYQLYCGIYLGLLLALPIGLILIIGYIRRVIKVHSNFIKWNLNILLAITVSAIPAMLLMAPYIRRSTDMPQRMYEDIIGYIPTFKSYIFSKTGSLVWSQLSDIGSDIPHWYDHQIFTGGIAFVSLLFLLIYLAKVSFSNNLSTEEKKFCPVLLASLIFTFVFFTRIDYNSLYKFIFIIPGYSSMRAVARIINVQLLFFAIATAWMAATIFIRFKSKQAALFIVFLSLIIADNYVDPMLTYRTRKDLAQERLVPLIEQMRMIPPGSIVSYEADEPIQMDIAYHMDAMLVGQSFGLKTVNGYTGDSPRGYSDFWTGMSRESRIAWLTHMGVNPHELYVINLEKHHSPQ